MSGYRGLLMGCSRSYWISRMQMIYDVYGFGNWTWAQAISLGVSMADLRRLNYSAWFIKVKKENGNKTRLWRLTSDAEEYLVKPAITS
jgi:hypothetical protein